MNVIIKSRKKNWSGKEFSDLPAKVYSDFDAAISALNSFHFFRYDSGRGEYVPCDRFEKIEIIPITEDQKQRLILNGKARL